MRLFPSGDGEWARGSAAPGLPVGLLVLAALVGAVSGTALAQTPLLIIPSPALDWAATTALSRSRTLAEAGRAADAFAVALTAADLPGAADIAAEIARQLEATGLACVPPRGWLRVSTGVAGTRVVVASGSFVAPRTLGAAAGRHVLQLEAAGYLPREIAVTVEAGRGHDLSVALEPLVAGPGLAGTHMGRLLGGMRPSPGAPQDDTARWVVTASAFAVLVGGFAVHMASVDAYREAAWLARGSNPEEHAAKVEEAEARRTAAYVLYGVGLASTVVAVVLWLVDDSPAKEPPGITPALAPSPDGGLVGVQGRF